MSEAANVQAKAKSFRMIFSRTSLRHILSHCVRRNQLRSAARESPSAASNLLLTVIHRGWARSKSRWASTSIHPHMNRFLQLLAVALAIGIPCARQNRALGQTAARNASAQAPIDSYRALVTEYCVTCHNTGL